MQWTYNTIYDFDRYLIIWQWTIIKIWIISQWRIIILRITKWLTKRKQIMAMLYGTLFLFMLLSCSKSQVWSQMKNSWPSLQSLFFSWKLWPGPGPHLCIEYGRALDGWANLWVSRPQVCHHSFLPKVEKYVVSDDMNIPKWTHRLESRLTWVQ